ncbi:uridine phosphorylase [Allomyces macrogynus ATCC 38327]|uniref:Uridine phosphorylase n=1 Tax=Allomyces macrogynus (strain ATCC 38327) TaxID=578462 RepID=A0A0L0T283_ALLM3|nr:uridine phosphorylase [Allomyces macrogynus ATCC 38327]|eukprot:KNE68679.1 uridine phosphorylase [Allomyces macrogynus ATCC 38327]
MGLHAMTNANFPVDAEGHTYHVGVKPGEVANRIITVGDPARAILIGSYLDGGNVIDATNFKKYLNYVSKDIVIKTSPRLFTTVTGRYKGVPVSIVAIGMGVPMMDFFVREVRAVVQGPLHIIRFGSCGSLGRARAGDMIVATDSMACSRNYNYFHNDEDKELSETEFAELMVKGEGPYTVSTTCPADAELTDALVAALHSHVPTGVEVHKGLDITADSFYSSQARQDPAFRDQNAHLFTYLTEAYPTAECLQMESFGLLHLAKSARPLASGSKSIRTAACAMVFAHRVQNTWVDPALVEVLQAKASFAILDAVIAVEIDAKELHPEEGSVWAKN